MRNNVSLILYSKFIACFYYKDMKIMKKRELGDLSNKDF